MYKSFSGNYIPFYTRLLKRLAPFILVFIIAYLQVTYGRLSRGEMANYRIYWLIFFAICFIIGLYYQITRLRTIVNEIRFNENNLQILGQDFSTKFEDKLILDKVMIEIQEEEQGKKNVRYCLEIYSEDKYYYLNKFNDWNYQTLAEIVDEFKTRTGKNISGNDLYQELIKNTK